MTLLLVSCAAGNKELSPKPFPDSWWQELNRSKLAWWEISPATGIPGKSVVLSKRNELGLLSNFAPTPFKFKGKSYKSVEGLWQSMKYPESPKDIRFNAVKWAHTRAQVEQMVGFKAKDAGNTGSIVMKKLNIDWVSFAGKKMIYRDPNKGEHYNIIFEAMVAKLKQNPKVKELLLRTRNLELLPDHKVGKNDPPAWKYYKIWMKIRETL